MKHWTKGRLLRSSVLAGFAAAGLTAGSVIAQEETEEQAPVARSGDQIVITGSRIARDPANAPTPLIQITQDELLLTGDPNIIDTLSQIPALASSQVPTDTTGAVLGAGGLSLLNLRNLGAARTLTLVDGRRHVGSQPGLLGVDVDTIPRLLIRNVEVITGGSSAVYGSDAVAGVVNFILRDDFDGFEIDANAAQIARDGAAHSYRVSALFGRNLVNDRLNVWVSGEYETNDALRDEQIRFFQEASYFFGRDADPASAPNDGIIDNQLVFNVRRVDRVPGGNFTLATIVQPSPASNPLIPFSNCSGASYNPINPNGNCFVEEPGRTFFFDNSGNPVLADFGTDRTGSGIRRVFTIGGNGGPRSFFNDDRVPEQTAQRYAAGFTFELTPTLEVFGDMKYVTESNLYSFQPAFFDIAIRDLANPNILRISALNQFELGLDNAYISPALRDLVRNNTVTVYNANGTVAASNVPAPVAVFRNFASELGGRPQENNRDLERYVLGVRGDLPNFGFLRNLNWELGGTYGRVDDENIEFATVDALKYMLSADAVVDTLGVAGPAGNIVCRSQLATAGGGTYGIPALGLTLTSASPLVSGCVPSRIFGDGGYSDAAKDYILTSQTWTRGNRQTNFLGFVSGEVWDLFGAGNIGFSVGAEYREEETVGTFVPPSDSSGLLFANALAGFGRASYEVTEYFGEVRVPLLSGLPFIEQFEITAAGRVSDYSTSGQVDAYSAQALWVVNDQLTFRSTYGTAVRGPGNAELFNPLSQTFNAITDPCDANVIANTVDPTIRQNRISNCAADGIPTTFIDAAVGTKPGRSGGNPFLVPETSTSFTFSAILRPQAIDNLTIVLDYYDIEIEDAIATLSAQAITNGCYNGNSLNANLCTLITRDRAGTTANPFGIIDFIAGPVNYASLTTRGVDFTVNYGHDFSMFGADLGTLSYLVRGNWLINRSNFLNIDDPTDETAIDSTLGNPHFRAQLTIAWDPTDRLRLSLRNDYIGSQVLIDNRTLNRDVIERGLWNTEPFVRTDLTGTYDLRDNVRLRAGVVNLLDRDPPPQLNTNVAGFDNIFDFVGRRFFVGINANF